ncbi:OmpA family protein [Phenylobacterium sp.]|uniref:OmpA family protein n=1 Tax=Phenylobacterium sp. TaxID=1871053 RepID=UPI00286BC480|nr:OmpA family protein [Phenylobacterium sp.]
MSRHPHLPHALLIALLCAPALAGCLTPRARPIPSPAVLESRAHVGARVQACPAGDLAEISPVTVTFGFDDARISDAGQARMAGAAAWLACHAGTEVVIRPAADNHGAAAHQQDLAARRAQAVLDQLRALGDTASVVRRLALGAADPVTAPHLLIQAEGRGW